MSTIEIRQLAERVLCGTTWEDKLLRPSGCRDDHPGAAVATPRVPGRPAPLQLDNWQERDRIHFGDVRQLHTEKERGLVLHFFANHELLALELMALALLKFPEAPARFRRGLLQTLHDEQDHLQLYRERMVQIGVEFGEIPVNDFFWKTIAPMQSPMDFVTRLSLTLEQANLDYAAHYAGIYGELGDGDTAAILNRVYLDEIGHVKHGLTWFNRWRDPQKSEWDAYAAALEPPLTPNRAKGIGFNREGRLRAGLSEDFIDELTLFARSRGRCPAVFWFNPACEGEIAAGGVGFTPPGTVQSLAKDLASLPMFLGVKDDAVLVPERPSSPFLQDLLSAGFTLPEFVEVGKDAGVGEIELARRDIGRLHPWGRSPGAARFLQPLADNVPARQRPIWEDSLRAVYSKEWSAQQLRRYLGESTAEDWLCRPETVGTACTSVGQATDRVGQLHEAGFSQVVVKAPFAASGRDQVRFSEVPPRPSQIGWLKNIVAGQGCVVVEPWLDKVLDLSLQLEVSDAGCRMLGWTRFITDSRGRYVGSFVQGRLDGLAPAVRQFLYGDGRQPKRLQRLSEGLMEQLGGPMREAGVNGPVGIDMIVYRQAAGDLDDGDYAAGLRLKPIVEINPRFTMGHVALRFARQISAARTAVWLILRTCDIGAAGFADSGEFAARLKSLYPLKMTPNGEQIGSGVVFTTDPARAEAFVTLVAVARSLDGCKGMFAELPGKIGSWRTFC